jgi:transketolase
VSDVSDLGNLEMKFSAFGWVVERCDGNDDKALAGAFTSLSGKRVGPQVLIADTVKGKGVSFMEHFDAEATNGQYAYHSGALSKEGCEMAFAELDGALAKLCAKAGLSAVAYESGEIGVLAKAGPVQKLMVAYADSIKELGGERADMVVLDADLALDCGLIPFRSAYPDRFIECGIAEMDMVSMAGGLALSGKLPVVHSFACFLSTRPGEQIFNNATEHTKIIYAGTLAGLLPAAPGHSQQSVRDIALMGSVPGMTLFEPSCEAEVKMGLEWAVRENEGSSYLRLVIVQCEIDYALPDGYVLVPGRGCVLREGNDVVVFAYGPVMLQQAWLAAEILARQGVSVKVVNLPWLNKVDEDWLREISFGMKRIFTVDDHRVDGGQGQLIGALVARLGLPIPIANLGIEGIPCCGQAAEVLERHGLDAKGLSRVIRGSLR